MSELTAQHYLGIYMRRLNMIEKGITHPKAKVATGVRLLVTALQKMPPEEQVSLDATKERAVFRRTLTGDVIAQIEFNSN